MNINLTLLMQAIAFGVFIWFCAKFIWPPLMRAIETRQTQIADGLAAGEEGRHAPGQRRKEDRRNDDRSEDPRVRRSSRKARS